MDTLYDTVLVGVHVEVIEGRREGDSEGFGSVAGLMVNCSPTHMPSEPCGGTPRGSYTSEPDEQDEFPWLSVPANSKMSRISTTSRMA